MLRTKLIFCCISFVFGSRLLRRELQVGEVPSTTCVNWFGNNMDWGNIPFESMSVMSPWGFTPEGCTEAIVEPYGEYSCATYDYNADSAEFKSCNGDCIDGVCVNGYATPEPSFICSVGEEQNGSDCWPCAPGSYNANVGGVCSACNSGTYASEFGSATCTFCEIGFVAPNEASRECEACAEGYTTEGFGQTECVPKVTLKPTLEPTLEPLVCPVGEELLGSACIPCAPGTYNANAGGVCVVCSEGTYASELGSPVCTPCDVGSVAPLVGLQNCMLCPEGYTTEGNGQTECVPETTKEPTLEPTSESPVCSIGQELLENVCVPCVSGTYNANVGGVCTECTEGTYASSVGSVACMHCDVGFVAPFAGSQSCIACPEGYTTDGYGQTECFAETTKEPTLEPTAEKWEVIYYQTKLTCLNGGQKISQPCNGGRGTGCSYDACMQHCFDEDECNFFFHITSRSGCILYRSCELTRTPAFSGTTVQVTRD